MAPECCERLGFYCKNPDISPFMYGTLIFIIIGICGCLGTAALLPKKEKLLGGYLTTIATICMYMMWACTWLSQWHPVIYPDHNDNASICS